MEIEGNPPPAARRATCRATSTAWCCSRDRARPAASRTRHGTASRAAARRSSARTAPCSSSAPTRCARSAGRAPTRRGCRSFAGLVKIAEVKAGAVNHAIRVTFNNTENAYILPATHARQQQERAVPADGAAPAPQVEREHHQLPRRVEDHHDGDAEVRPHHRGQRVGLVLPGRQRRRLERHRARTARTPSSTSCSATSATSPAPTSRPSSRAPRRRRGSDQSESLALAMACAPCPGPPGTLAGAPSPHRNVARSLSRTPGLALAR